MGKGIYKIKTHEDIGGHDGKGGGEEEIVREDEGEDRKGKEKWKVLGHRREDCRRTEKNWRKR